MNIIGNVDGLDAVLIDDMIDTAGTITHAAQALFLAGLACLWWAQAGGPAGRVAWTLGGAFLGGLAWSFVGPARLATIGQIALGTENAIRTLLGMIR